MGRSLSLINLLLLICKPDAQLYPLYNSLNQRMQDRNKGIRVRDQGKGNGNVIVIISIIKIFLLIPDPSSLTPFCFNVLGSDLDIEPLPDVRTIINFDFKSKSH
jgi:hypothetical protein